MRLSRPLIFYPRSNFFPFLRCVLIKIRGGASISSIRSHSRPVSRRNLWTSS
jgi:hypothetical protein